MQAFLTEDGDLLFDSLITRLQALGENFKKIEKIDGHFIPDELHLDATSIIRFRDIISHHYELLDYEVIFKICKTEIPATIAAVENYLTENRLF